MKRLNPYIVMWPCIATYWTILSRQGIVFDTNYLNCLSDLSKFTYCSYRPVVTQKPSHLNLYYSFTIALVIYCCVEYIGSSIMSLAQHLYNFIQSADQALTHKIIIT